MPITAVPTSARSRWALMMLDAGGRIQRCSRHAAQLFGRHAEQLSGWPIQALVPRLPLQPASPGFNLAFATFWHRANGRLRLSGIDAHGTRLALDVEVRRIKGRAATAADPVIGLFVRCRGQGDGRDRGVSDLARYLAAVAGSLDGVVVTDRKGSIVELNPASGPLLGCAPAQARGVPLRQFFAGSDSEDRRAAQRPVWSRTDANRGRIHLEPSVRPFVDRAGTVTHYVYTLRDISESVTSNARLVRLAQYDHLTGLPNRALFDDRLRREVVRYRRHDTGFALLYLDVDRFKSINDRHGHAAGDGVLLRVAQRLTRAVRDEDTVARVGGDEFAILLCGSAARGDVTVALDVIQSALHAPLRLSGGTTIHLSASIGVACCPADGSEPDGLTRMADAAMYSAKRAGGQRARFATGLPSRPGSALEPPRAGSGPLARLG